MNHPLKKLINNILINYRDNLDVNDQFHHYLILIKRKDHQFKVYLIIQNRKLNKVKSILIVNIS